MAVAGDEEKMNNDSAHGRGRGFKSIDYMIPAACAVLMIILILPLAGSITDDTYIHMQYAKNLAEAGELSFNRGDPTYGATSPLWVFSLALVHRVGGDMLVWTRVLSLFFGLASIFMVYRLVLALDMNRQAAAAAALIMASEAWLVRWSAVGMETSLAVFMVITVFAASPGVVVSYTRSFLFGFLMFLAFLVRPEAMLLFPLAVFSFLIIRDDRPLSMRFAWLLVFVPGLIIWLIIIKGHTGTFFPLTAGAKQGHIEFSTILLKRLVVPAKILAASVGIPVAAIILLLVKGLRRERKLLYIDNAGNRACIFLILMWILALPVAYVLIDFQILSRYLVPVSPAVIVLGVLAVSRLSGRYLKTPSVGRWVMAGFTAAVIIQNILFLNLVVVNPTKEFSKGIQDVLVGMGIYLSENSDPGDVIAAPDIGAIGYYSNRRILDLGGLVTPGINRIRSKIDYETMIEEGLYLEFGADYMLDRDREPMRFSGRVISGTLFTPVLSGVVPNLGIRRQEPVTYVLYRLDAARSVPAEIRESGER